MPTTRRALGKTDPAVNRYFYEALAALGEEKSRG